MSGFDCEFVNKPPEVLQTHCPVCLLILCEPYQVTCCGKSFCKECIKKIKTRSQPCPTCKHDKFEFFSNKGLQQPLYGFAVFCSNKERGCVWEGGLGQLDQHINSNPDKEKQLIGCVYTSIACLFCDKLHPRPEMEQHQTSLCPKRPFTCFMCEEYESTYEDVVNSHSPVCKCRPVECPNSCGADNLQHQHLEEHVSSQCPLTYVECEFSDAGCDAKVYRKDLASHLTDNLVTHMSLLAMENRKLKMQLIKQGEKAVAEIQNLQFQLKEATKYFESQLESERKFTKATICRVPPIDLLCPAKIFKDGGKWLSDPFYSRIGNRKLQIVFLFSRKESRPFGSIEVSCNLLDEQFRDLKVVIVLKDHVGSRNVTFMRKKNSHVLFSLDASICYVKTNHLHFCITDIEKI